MSCENLDTVLQSQQINQQLCVEFGEETIHAIHERLQEELGVLDVLMTCPHRNRDMCGCRKPRRNVKPCFAYHSGKSHSTVDWWGEKPKPIHPLDLMVGDRDSDMGAGWAVGARLFKVDQEIGIQQVIERIINGDPGDDFRPV